ncbi:right-handed parallel beta-helix repeat-containing protein [Thermovibrio sp.]
MEYAGRKLKMMTLGITAALLSFSCASSSQAPIKCSQKLFFGSRVIFVSPNGKDTNEGFSPKEPLKTIEKALKKAQPGDTIVLMTGTYHENVKITKSGLAGKPITIVGEPGAEIRGNWKKGGRIIDITASYIHLINLNIDGKITDGIYHDKLIYIHGSYRKHLKGIKILRNTLKNALGECLRIKFTDNSTISWNSISHCGIRDFVYHRGKQNGEGIYVGTAPEQTPGKPDTTKNIYIFNNFIATYGAECVDVKEGTTNIYIKDNLCTQEKAPHVGGISVRGNGSYIIGNIVYNNEGAGIRLGGDTKNFGINNTVIDNYLTENKFAGIKIMVSPQKVIKDNIIKGEKREIYKPKSK